MADKQFEVIGYCSHADAKRTHVEMHTMVLVSTALGCVDSTAG